jgi:protein ImuA
MPDSPASIPLLRQMVADLEARREPSRADPVVADGWLHAGLARAQVHDIHAADAADGPAAIGFAVALALAGGALPALWVRTERDERRAGRLHAGGLVELGLPPPALILVVVPDETALLRVAADAARCPALGLVLVETHGEARGLDLTATRRLMLAAEGSGVMVLSVRVGGAVVPSAAATRWRVAATPSAALEAEAPGLPAFDVECLRRRGGPAGARTRVEWNRDTRCFVPADRARQAPLAGAGLPLAAGGAAARHPPASVRRAG